MVAFFSLLGFAENKFLLLRAILGLAVGSGHVTFVHIHNMIELFVERDLANTDLVSCMHAMRLVFRDGEGEESCISGFLQGVI